MCAFGGGGSSTGRLWYFILVEMAPGVGIVVRPAQEYRPLYTDPVRVENG